MRIWLALLGVMVCSAAAVAQVPKPEAGKGPIEITADVLDVHQDKQVAVFSGDVLAIQGDMSLKADKMTVYYRNAEQAKDGAERISRIDVDGDVFLATPEESARGKKGVYHVDQKILRLYQDVVLTQGKNVLKGEALEYDMNTGRSRIASAGVVTTPTGQKTNQGRVRGLFIPDEGEGKK